MSSTKRPRPGASTSAARPPAPADPPISRVDAVLLGLILLLAAGLCFYGLDTQCLGLDEMWTYCMSDFPSMEYMLSVGKAAVDAHPPLHHIFYYGWIKFVGSSPTVLRLPSAVAGFLAVGAVFLLGRRLYSTRVGLMAAALLAVFSNEVFYCQEARANSMLVLLAAVSFYFWIPVARSLSGGAKAGGFAHVAYTACVLLMGYLHYFGTLLAGLQAIALVVVLLVNKPKNVLVVSFYFLPLFAALVAWWYVWIPNWLRTFQEGSPLVTFDAPTIAKFLHWISWAIMPAWRWLTLVVLALFAWIVVRALLDRHAPAGLLRRGAGERPATPHAGLLLALWLTAPFALIYLASFVTRSLYNERNFVICLPALALLIARGLDGIPGPRAVAAGLCAAAVAGIFWGLVFDQRYYTVPCKAQFREAVEFIADRCKNDPKFARAPIAGYMCDNRFYDYYFERCGSDRRVDIRLREDKRALESDLKRIEALVERERPEYVWFVRGHWVPSQKTPQLEEWFKEHWTLVPSQSRSFLYAEARLYRPVPPK